jgi:pantetheine-phosphate adenylyltransferase
MTKGIDNISVDILTDGLLVDYAFDNEIEYLIRGIRNTNDFVYEKDMREVNDDLSQLTCRSVFLLPSTELCHISSSLVRGLLKSGGRDRIHLYVPMCVDKYIKEKGL